MPRGLLTPPRADLPDKALAGGASEPQPRQVSRALQIHGYLLLSASADVDIHKQFLRLGCGFTFFYPRRALPIYLFPQIEPPICSPTHIPHGLSVPISLPKLSVESDFFTAGVFF